MALFQIYIGIMHLTNNLKKSEKTKTDPKWIKTNLFSNDN